MTTSLGLLGPEDTFPRRHVGSGGADLAEMLRVVGVSSLEELVEQTVPAGIRLGKPLYLPAGVGETAALEELRGMAKKNKVARSFIGMGYYDTVVPPVILRNILENPGWYTAYTPYQAEISQGRLEALLNFQTMVSDLTALPVANASMLDEATAAAEAMHMCASANPERPRFFVSENCHPQTIAVVKTRAKWLGIEVVVGNTAQLTGTPHGNAGPTQSNAGLSQYCGILVQYPGTDGRIEDFGALCEAAHKAGALVVAACDLLALTLIVPPGEWNRGGAGGGGGYCGGFGATVWRADGVRGAARGVYGVQNRIHPQTPGPHRRPLQRRPRQPRLSPRHPNPRTTHPPRKSHQQHLHRPSPPRHHGQHVRRLPRPRWPQGHRTASSRSYEITPRSLQDLQFRSAQRAIFRHSPCETQSR